MRAIWLSSLRVFFLVLLVTQQGCSIYWAAVAPSPVHVERVKAGAARADVLGVLGAPKSSSSSAERGERTDFHEFQSGYHPATKARILVYAFGDFMTIGLSELLFWPLELAVFSGRTGRATITYDAEDRVKGVAVRREDGSPWVEPDDGRSPRGGKTTP